MIDTLQEQHNVARRARGIPRQAEEGDDAAEKADGEQAAFEWGKTEGTSQSTE
jgi:hypothetical protein